MKFKLTKKKVAGILIIIIVLIYLNYPLKATIDVNNTESITINLTESNSTKSTNYSTKITDYNTMTQISEILNNITYKKISYFLDIDVLGYPGYSIEIKDSNGDINIIKIYFDDTARIQSNGRYKLEKGMYMKTYDELLAILKSK